MSPSGPTPLSPKFLSPAFGRPPLQTNSRVHVPFSAPLGKPLSCLEHAAPCWHRTNTFMQWRAHTRRLSAWMQTQRLRFWLLIHKVFSKAVIYPIGLSLNAFEWDQSNYNLQRLMGKREKTRKENSQWNKAGSAFMWLCFWKPLWTRGVCVLFCSELNRQYLQGLDIYLICSFSTGHRISVILWNLGRCKPDRRRQGIWLNLTNCLGESGNLYTFFTLGGYGPAGVEVGLFTLLEKNQWLTKTFRK